VVENFSDSDNQMSFEDFMIKMNAKAEEKMPLSAPKWEKAMELKYNFMKSIGENDDISDVETFSAYVKDKMENFEPKMPAKLVIQKIRNEMMQLSKDDRQALMEVRIN
jgi:hypothetical protein